MMLFFTAANREIYYNGIITAAALLFAVCPVYKSGKKLGIEVRILYFLLAAIPFGFILSRIYFLTFSSAKSGVGVFFNFRDGGYSVTGAFIAFFICCIVYSRLTSGTGVLLNHTAAPAALGLAIGKLGGFFDFSCTGTTVLNDKLKFFPVALYDSITEKWYFAVFLYDFLSLIMISAFLHFKRHLFREKGDVFIWFLALYGAVRTITESLRTDSLYIGFVRINQVFAIVLLISSIFFYTIRTFIRNRSLIVGCICVWVLTIIFTLIAFLSEYNMTSANYFHNHIVMLGAISAICASFGVFYFMCEKKTHSVRKV